MTTKFALSMLLAAVAAYGGYSLWRLNGRTDADGAVVILSNDPKPLDSLAGLKLVDSADRPFAFDRLDGQVWVGNLFFTSCMFECKQITETIQRLQADESLAGAKFVSVSCDPENDTPARLGEYAKMLQADGRRWTFLTGPMDDVQQFSQRVLDVWPKTRDHGSRLAVIDRRGQWRGSFDATSPTAVAELRGTLAKVLAER